MGDAYSHTIGDNPTASPRILRVESSPLATDDARIIGLGWSGPLNVPLGKKYPSAEVLAGAAFDVNSDARFATDGLLVEQPANKLANEMAIKQLKL